MRKVLFTFALLFLSILAGAQEPRKINFVYIAHSDNGFTEKLVETLKKVYYAADESNLCIMYLANLDSPIIIRSYDKMRDNVEKFWSEFSSHEWHDINTEVDLKKILEIVAQENLLGQNFAFTNFDFYIDKEFAKRHFADVIAKTSFCLELPSFKKERVRVQVFSPKEEGSVKSFVEDPKGLIGDINLRYSTY